MQHLQCSNELALLIVQFTSILCILLMLQQVHLYKLKFITPIYHLGLIY